MLPDRVFNEYNSEPFFTPFPPVFLANTAIILYQAIKDDPQRYEDIYQWGRGAVAYDIGAAASIYYYWLTAPQACDAGKKYGTSHYGWGPTQYYRSIPGSPTTGFCGAFFDHYTWELWGMGNVKWVADQFWENFQPGGAPWDIFRRNPQGGVGICWQHKVDPENCQCAYPLYHPCNCTETGLM